MTFFLINLSKILFNWTFIKINTGVHIIKQRLRLCGKTLPFQEYIRGLKYFQLQKIYIFFYGT